MAHLRDTVSIGLGAATLLAACAGNDPSAGATDPPRVPAVNSGAASDLPGSGASGNAAPPDTAASLQRHKAEMLTSIWENSTTVLQYGFSRDNGDGYGYTSGRAGFTTATSDSYFVVQCFDAKFGTGSANLMHKYAPVLQALSKKQQSTGSLQGDTQGLDAVGNYNADWKATATASATAPSFIACQDEVVAKLYFQPTLAIAKQWGLVSGLAMALLYDSSIVHGEDGVKELARRANEDTGNGGQTPAASDKSQQAESDWLKAFLVRRVAMLASSDAWSGAIDRAANYERIRQSGNWDLSAPIVTDAKTNKLFSGGPYTDGRYPRCVIAANGDVGGDAECTARVAD